MILDIIAKFKDLVRCYKPIKSFYCNLNAYKGSGKEVFPLLWLEEPFYGNVINKGQVVRYDISFEVLYLPETDTNEERLKMIDLAETDCINIVEAIKKNHLLGLSAAIENYSVLSLDEYTDNKACGCRCSMTVNVVNSTPLCDLSSYFDSDKELVEGADIPDFRVDEEGCITKTGFKLNL